MNHPAMQGLELNTPSYVKNAQLIAWVADMVALCKPDTVYWCDGSDAEYQRLCQQLVDAGTFKKTERSQAAEQLSRAQRPERRGAGGRPHLHLLGQKRRRRPDQQLDGAGRDARHTAAPF